MKKTTLIAPFDDTLSLAIADQARSLGRSVAPLLPGIEAASDAEADPPEERPIPWNPPSYISARSAFLEAVVRFGSVDEAVLVASAGPAPGLTAKPAQLEKHFQDRVLGYLYLVREILSHFSERGAGRLVFVVSDRGEPPRTPVAAAALGALDAFAACLAGTLQDAPYDIWTLRASCPQDELTAQYISKILAASNDRRSDRVLKFTGKASIFNRL